MTMCPQESDVMIITVVHCHAGNCMDYSNDDDEDYDNESA